MVICHCEAVNDAAIRDLLDAPAPDEEQLLSHIAAHCGAGSQCGGCLDSIRAIVAAHTAVGPTSVLIRH